MREHVPDVDDLVRVLHGDYEPVLVSADAEDRDPVAEEVGGDYGVEGYVYQALAPLAEFAGNHPIFGVWVVDHAAAGLGIREDTRRITGNLSRFVPHFFN